MHIPCESGNTLKLASPVLLTGMHALATFWLYTAECFYRFYLVSPPSVGPIKPTSLDVGMLHRHRLNKTTSSYRVWITCNARAPTTLKRVSPYLLLSVFRRKAHWLGVATSFQELAAEPSLVTCDIGCMNSIEFHLVPNVLCEVRLEVVQSKAHPHILDELFPF